MVLGREALRQLLAQEPPLVKGLVNLEEQLQPQGIDLTVRSVSRFGAAGQLGQSNEDRLLPPLVPLAPGENGYWNLGLGPYMITYNEEVRIPGHLMALGRPRSSMLRCGATLHTAVWDAGYYGRSQSLLVVHHPSGFRLAKDARVMQLVFLALTEELAQGYSGAFQGENL